MRKRWPEIFEPEAQARASQLSLGFPVTCFMTALRETRNSSSRLDATVWAMNAELTGGFIDDSNSEEYYPRLGRGVPKI